MITVVYRYGRDELHTTTVHEVPVVGDEVTIPAHAIPVWTVTGRRWLTLDRERGPQGQHVEVWLVPC